MSSQIDALERVVEMSVIDLIENTKGVMENMGDRPFLQKKKTEEERVLDYAEQRTKPYSMWYRADGIRQELEERLRGVSDEERESNGLSKDEVTRIAYTIVLKEIAEIQRLARKLGIPIVGSEELPPPPPEDFGGDMWQDSTMPMAMDGTLPSPTLPPVPPPAPSMNYPTPLL